MRSVPASASGTPDHGGTAAGRVLSRNVVALGLTSFFTDISSEMVLAVVPLFLTTGLGFSIFGFGLFEAAYQGTSATFRVWGGAMADHRQRHKQTAATGYAISALTRLGLVVAALSAAIPAIPFLLADRVGKGIRTAPRDALISLSAPADRLAVAFGVHRALDTAGAMLGPLVAFVVLAAAPGRFDAVFVVSAVVGVVGVMTIVTFAQEKPQVAPGPDRRPRLRTQWRQVLAAPGMARLALASALVSMFTVGDAFVYLVIQRTTDMSARYFPLLFVGTAVAYLALAVPFGRTADRRGAAPVFLAGHGFLIGLYLVAGLTDLNRVAAVGCLGLLGAYYAATDGVVSAMASQRSPAEVRASGIALVTVVIAVAKMISAAVFGLLWQTLGHTEALTVYVAAMGISVIVAARLFRTREVRHESR